MTHTGLHPPGQAASPCGRGHCDNLHGCGHCPVACTVGSPSERLVSLPLPLLGALHNNNLQEVAVVRQ